jgi:phage FluMu gp28-like protein
MAVHGGDVGLDEFAKHPNARLLWETAQGRVTWGYDMGVWSSHDGQDTEFNDYCQKAHAGAPPWNLVYRVTMADAIELGLLDVINRTQGTHLSPEQFLADCRARAGSEEIFQQAYMCNPMGAASNHIVEYSAIENCRYDYQIARAHFEHDQIIKQFGAFRPDKADDRERQIYSHIFDTFRSVFQTRVTYRLGFDVAASGQGDLAVIYLDERKGSELWLRALFTCRTDDWHFLSTVLCCFLREQRNVKGLGDETGLGRQICWETAKLYPSRFAPVNFSSKKHDIGFALMNQLATAQKRFPRSEQDIATDYFALRKSYEGSRWVFSESPNSLNPASHCDIAWAGGLATEAHNSNKRAVGGFVV